MFQLKELGEYLKETRENHGVSIDEAAEDLNLTIHQLDNIESGNTRAFKDIYELRELVREYAKYLGLEPDKVIDEFNDFLFEKTSKISLQDIMDAKKKSEEEPVKKVSSPYTNIPPSKKNYGPVVLLVLGMILMILIFYILLQNREKDPVRTDELKGSYEVREEVL